MNIALVIFRANPAIGGAERYTVDLAVALAANGHAVSLISSEFGPTAAQADQPPPLPSPGVPGDGKETRVTHVLLRAAAPTRLGRYLHFLDSLETHLAEHRYDVVHAMLPVRHCDIYHPHAGLAAEAVASGHLKHGSAARRLVSKIATRLNRKRNRFAAVERRLLTGDRPPLVLCLSDYVRASVLRHYPNLAGRLKTVVNGVDLQRFDPAADAPSPTEIRKRFHIGPDEIVALLIAQDFARKGVGRAIAAMSRLPAAPPTRLLVVGKQNPGKYRAMAGKLKLGDRVIFVAATDNPRDFYRAADFFVLPTSHDPCSLVVLEALAMALPVISTVRNGACQVMENGRHGFVLPDPDDIEALAGAMRQLLDEPRRAEMRQACLQLRAQLSLHEHLRRLEEIYAGLATAV